jgi:hypothetical protein
MRIADSEHPRAQRAPSGRSWMSNTRTGNGRGEALEEAAD